MQNISFEPLKEPRFIHPKLIRYTYEDKSRTWEVVEVHDSVAILLYHVQKEAFILVKQLRPAVFLKNQDGFTYELCAGICDKDTDLETIAREEILEECGYAVTSEQLQRVTGFFTAVGFAGSHQTLFYAQIDESMKETSGGGVDVESIEVIELPKSDALAFIHDERYAKTPGLMYAFMWWFANHSTL